MAETSGFFNAEMIEDDGSATYDRIYYADQFAYYFSKFISNGVYINPATQLKVTSKGELKLNVAVGDAFINGYWYKNDENFELQLAQANGSLPRIDRIVLRWDSLTRYINLAILQGNPAATPSAKNLTRNADTWELGLADVYIERGVLSISDANVTDLRPDRTYCGYVAGVVNQIDTTNLFAQFTDAFEQYYEKQVTASDKFSSDLAKKYNDYAVLAETNFGKWMTDTKGDFDTWYETIQAMLSDEEAVKLANQISELKKQFQLLALRGLKTDLFELASNNGSVFTENAQNAYVFLKQIYGKSELVNDAFISVGESGTLEFDSVDTTNENVSSAKLTTGMPLRGFVIDDVSVANYTDANGKYWLCDSIELSVDGYWYCIKRVGSILSYNSESVGSIYKTPTGTLDKGKQVLYKLSDYAVSKLTDEEQIQLSELLSYGGGKLPVTTGSNAAEAIQLHVEQNVTDENGVHNLRFRNGLLQYKEGGTWKDITINADVSVATKENAGVVKPDGKSMSVDESGTLSINLDGTTITLDEAKNVIKLADTLKDKIGSALQPESIVNNQVTTETGFALDARQANPNLDGTLAKQISTMAGRLGYIYNIPETFASFASIPGSVGIHTYCVTGGEAVVADSPYPNEKGWWNVVQFGTDGNGSLFRLTQITSQVYRTEFGFKGKDELWIRSRHDELWSPWKQFNMNDRKYITDNNNINDDKFFEPGKYYCSYNVIAETLSNAPFTTAFFMEVFDPTNVNQYIAQRATEFNTGHCKYRIRDSGNKHIDAWVQLY